MNRMANQIPDIETANSRSSLLYKVSGAAALMVAILLLLGMLGPITGPFQPGSTGPWSAPLQNNWLIVIFKLHAGFSGAQIGLLHALDFLDIAILALAGIMYLGLYVALKRTSRIWSIVAAIQPFLGIGLFIATRTWGRSAAMGAALVISLVMLRSNVFQKAIAYLGITASLFLLAGDFSAGMPASAIMASLFGIAYLLFMAWFIFIGVRLFRLGQVGSRQLVL